MSSPSVTSSAVRNACFSLPVPLMDGQNIACDAVSAEKLTSLTTETCKNVCINACLDSKKEIFLPVI